MLATWHATEAAAHFRQLSIAADDACASASQCPLVKMTMEEEEEDDDDNTLI
jgi:hypothetical protein